MRKSVFSSIEQGDTSLVDIETNDAVSRLGRRQCERQANVAHTHDAHVVVARCDAREERVKCYRGCRS